MERSGMENYCWSENFTNMKWKDKQHQRNEVLCSVFDESDFDVEVVLQDEEKGYCD